MSRKQNMQRVHVGCIAMQPMFHLSKRVSFTGRSSVLWGFTPSGGETVIFIATIPRAGTSSTSLWARVPTIHRWGVTLRAHGTLAGLPPRACIVVWSIALSVFTPLWWRAQLLSWAPATIRREAPLPPFNRWRALPRLWAPAVIGAPCSFTHCVASTSPGRRSGSTGDQQQKKNKISRQYIDRLLYFWIK